jgi:hypothetical protein
MATASDSLPAAQEIDTQLRALLAQTDDARAAHLVGLAGVRAARTVVLTRERARLLRELPEDHPRIQALDARIAREQTHADGFRTEAARAQHPTPAPDPKAFILHGYVVDGSGRGLSGMTVALYLEHKRLEGLDCHATDETGYFLLTLRGELLAQPGHDARSASHHPKLTLELRVLDPHGTCLLQDPEPVVAAPGHVTYRVLTVEPAQR